MPNSTIRGLVAVLMFIVTIPALGQAGTDDAPLLRASIVTRPAAAFPGAAIDLGVRLTVADHWKVGAGDSSGDALEDTFPTSITLALPDGWTAGAPIWPVAREFSAAGLKATGYEGDVVVVFPVTVPPDTAPGDLELSADVTYLACNDEVCDFPTDTTARGTLTILAPGTPLPPIDADVAALFGATMGDGGPLSGAPVPDDVVFAPGAPLVVSLALDQSALTAGSTPQLAVVLDVAPRWHIQAGAGSGDEIEDFLPTKVTLTLPDGWTRGAPIWPLAHDFETGGLFGAGYEGRSVVLVPLTVADDAAPGSVNIAADVFYQACDDQVCNMPTTTTVTFTTNVVADGVDIAPVSPAIVGLFPRVRPAPRDGTLAGVAAPAALGFLWLLFLAVIGGAALNFTPCVLPIIPLKVMGLAKSGGTRARTFALGVAMSIGILFFFAVLGLAIALVNSVTSANQIFQYPWLVIAIGIIIVVLAIGMCGLFSIRLPNVVYSVTPSHDTYSGSFLFGIMAAVLSTPCTAPFMGTAMVAAVGRSTLVVLSVFLAVGLGMALPYLLLAANPKWIDRLPRTGPGSELLKQVLGLFMLAAAAYFIGVGISGLMVTPPAPPSRIYFWFVFAITAAAGVWLAYKTFVIIKRPVARTVCAGLGVLVVGASVVLPSMLTDKGPIAWTYYTPEAFEDALADGKVVVVEFTAEWCLNCKALEKTVLHTNAVARRLAASDVVPIKVDLTGSNPRGNAMLNESGSVTIPWLVVYRSTGEAIFKRNFYSGAEVIDAIDGALRE